MEDASVKRFVLIMFCMVMLVLCFGCSDNEDTIASIEDKTPTQTETEESVTQTYEVDTLTGIDIYWVDDSNLEEGIDFSINDCNQIISFEDKNDECTFDYNENGSVSYITVTHKNDNTIGYHEFYYTDDLLTGFYYDLNNYRSIQDASITVTTNEEGYIIDLVETIEYTDSDDGSKSDGTDHYVINYDSENRVSSADYYHNGDFDHTARFTYNTNGNITVYSCVDRSNNEYLRVEFEYSTNVVEEPVGNSIDGFTAFYNLVNIVNYIL